VPQVVAYGLAVALFFAVTFRIPHKGWCGFGQVAEWLIKTAKPEEKFLVSSDARGEGMFIAEVAMRDPRRPLHIAERSSKKLADSDWSGGSYTVRYAETMNQKKDQRKTYNRADDLFTLLLADSVAYFVLDRALEAQQPHHKVLQEVIDRHPEAFTLEQTFPLERTTKEIPDGKVYADGIAVYRLKR
jgi:hypothetical protein